MMQGTKYRTRGNRIGEIRLPFGYLYVFILNQTYRQDLLSTGFGGITLAMFGTAFIAALLGALVAPALSAGITRITEFELPEITLPEISESVDDEVRSLKTKYPWVEIVENVYSAFRAELNFRNSPKFNKFIHNKL